MKNVKEYILIVFNIVILIMMCFKNSISFIGSNGIETFINYYSYFDIIVFGSGDIFALPSAVLNIILIFLSLLNLLCKNKELKRICFFTRALFILFFITSVFLTGNVTIYQWIIILIITIEFIISSFFFLKNRKHFSNDISY